MLPDLSILDPSTSLNPGEGISAKMGLDATRPLAYDEHVFTRLRIPGEESVRVEDEVDPAPAIDWARRLAD